MTVEEALAIVEQIHKLGRLSKVEEAVFRQAWEGHSYQEIADATSYDVGYVKDTGSKLWQMLSEALGERVTKQNFIAVLKRSQLSAATKGAAPQPSSPARHQDWGEAPDVSIFYNRSKELDQLEQWILQDRCRVVACLGMGGIGKTALSVKLAEQVQGEFQFLIWRSLRDIPSLSELLLSLIRFLSQEQETNLPETQGGQVSRLMEYLKLSRCLLILDNYDALFQPCQRVGTYRSGYEGYGELLRRIGEGQHQSCLILTSRDKPLEVGALQGENLSVRVLSVQGLQEVEGQKLLKAKGLSGPENDLHSLVRSYQGNPLALKITATSIQDLFGGNVLAFLRQKTTVFNGIRSLLNLQIERLSALEVRVMYWLAINREPVCVEELQADIIPSVSTLELLEALESLRWRSLIEKAASVSNLTASALQEDPSAAAKPSDGFTQQPVVMEYMTERFVHQIFQEIVGAQGDSRAADRQTPFLKHYALMKATARDYIRDSQTWMILGPVIQRAIAELGTKQDLIEQINDLLCQLRQDHPTAPSYAAGNLINLLRQLGADLTGSDFSHFTVWQAYLADVNLQKVNFSHADLAKSVFAETFGGISCVAFSPDDRLLATSDTGGAVQIWDVSSGKQLQAFKADNAWTWSVAFSPDSRLLGTAGDDYIVKLWDVETGKCLHRLKGHTATLNAIAFHPNGRLLASCSQDATIRLWQLSHLDQDPLLQVLQGHQKRVWSIAFSPDGKTLVSGSEDQTLKLWDLDTGQCLQTLRGHSDRVMAIAVSPDQQTIASGGFDGVIKLWEVSSGECLQTWQGHSSNITSLDFSPDSQWLASASYDQAVKVWEIASGQCLKTLREHSNRVWSVAFSSNGEYLVSGGDDHSARLWHLKTGQCVKAWKGHTNSILSLALNGDQQLLATGHEDQTIKLWNLQTGEVSKTLRGHSNRVWAVVFAPPQPDQNSNNQLLASGSADNTIRIWNLQTGRTLKTLAHKSWVWSVAFNADGRWLASGSYDYTIKLWDTYSGECLATLKDHQAPVIAVLFAPDSQWLASSSFDATIKLWNPETGQCVQTLQGHTNSVWALAFSPDGKVLASSSYDQTVKLWDVQTGLCLHTFEGHLGPVVSLAFHPSGQYLASGSFDRTVKVWDIKTKQCLRTSCGHAGLVSSLAFQCPNADSGNRTPAQQSASTPYETLLSGSFDETIRLWNSETGQCLQTLHTPRPYDGMDITGVNGLNDAQKATLKALGAVEKD